ncbi:MAG: recombinase family protein [Cyanothece sp. SIO1E1]|nr:recombinase family protein [Cyanothece sp. SIO1E1]
MKVIAYVYSDPLLESPPDVSIWNQAVDRVYQDYSDWSDRSTSPGMTRPQLQQLLQDCQIDPPDRLLIRRLEELGNSLQEVSDRLSTLEALGIQLIATEQAYPVTAGQSVDTQSSMPSLRTHLRADLIYLLGEIQQHQRSRQIRQGHARNRVKALPPPGKPPYGYRRGKDRYILDRTVAPIVKDFFEHFLLYGSLRGSVRHLEKKYNKKISVSTGRRWLTNPVYRGDLAYHNGQTIMDTHAPMISREEAAQVDRLLRRNRRLAPRTASAPRSLAGLITCAACQSSMTVTRVNAPGKQREYLYLRPVACPQRPKCKAIQYEQVLEQAIQAICRELPQAVAGLKTPNMDGMKGAIATQLKTKQDILGQLPDLMANGILDAATAELRAYTLRTEIAEIQSRLAQLPPVNLQEIAQTVSIPQFWLDLSEAERRFYFREFIRQIQLIRQNSSWQLAIIFIF